MSTADPRTLIPASSLALFAVAGLGLIAAVVPSRREIGELQIRSFLAVEAEAPLRQSALDHPREPLALRELADSLEAQGKLEETVELRKRLVELRPRNLGYREALIQSLSWSHRSLEAAREREALLLLKRGGRESRETFDDWLALAHDYEWLEAQDDALRIYERLREQGYFADERLPELIGLYLQLDRAADAEKLYADHVSRRLKPQPARESALMLYRGMLDLGEPMRALPYGYLALGAAASDARGAATSTAFVARLPLDALRAQPYLADELVWLPLDAKAPRLAVPLLARMGEAGLLDARKRDAFVEALVETGDRASALRELRVLALGLADADAAGWRRISDQFLRAGDGPTAELILQTLLKGESPRRLLAPSPTTTSWRRPLRWLAEQAIPTAQAARRQPAPPRDDADRLETYEHLIRTQESRRDSEGARETLAKLHAEVMSGRLRASRVRADRITEDLALRESWELRTSRVLDLLGPLAPTGRLSARGRALYALALDERGSLEEAEAERLKIGPKARASLAPEYRERLADLERRHREARGEAARDRINDLASRDGAILSRDALADAASEVEIWRESTDNLGAEAHLQATETLFAPGLRLVGARQLRRSAQWAWTGLGELDGLVYANAVPAATSVLRGLVGGEVRRLDDPGSLRVRAMGGWRSGGRSLEPQARLLISGAMGQARYQSLSFDLAEPIDSTETLRAAGVSETRLTAYDERRLAPWSELSTSVVARSTHLRDDLNQGRGIDAGARLGFGPSESIWRVGPWAALTRWTSGRQDVSSLFESQATVVGAYASLRLGPLSDRRWHVRVAGGWGADLARAPESGSTLDSGFVEAAAERVFNSGWGTRFEYSFYSGQLRQGPGLGSHSAMAGVYRQF